MRPQLPPQPPTDPSLKVLIACDHASASYGGEAILPLHHFRVLRDGGFDVWLVAHSRTRAELSALFPGETRIRYVEETALDRWMWRIGRRLPATIGYLTTGFVSRLAVQLAQRRLVRRLVGEAGIDVVHQPIPVSPREPSLLHDVGAPVVIGPMNGDMRYPPAFGGMHLGIESAVLLLGRWAAPLLNRWMPGKRKAALLLVANERTRAALPGGLARRVEVLAENGVELDLWTRRSEPRPADAPVTFAFVGRLIGLKAVDLLLEALAIARRRHPMRLLVIGDGKERAALERQAGRLFGAQGAGGMHSADPVVRFTGLLPQTECAERLRTADALVLPSLHDCGGAVILEAMAMELPVIATAWGGPLDYLDASCGILVAPASRTALVDGLAAAMVRLAVSPDERAAMGRLASERVRRDYDWTVKGVRMVALYREIAADTPSAARRWRAPPSERVASSRVSRASAETGPH